MATDARVQPGAWAAVGFLWFVAFFNYAARLMLTTMHQSILESFPITDAQFGLLTSLFLWTYGLCSPLAGFLSDRFSRSRVITLSLFSWSMATWLTAYAKNYHQLLALRALMGASEACYMPAALALITDYHRGSTRSLAVGIHMTGLVIGGALGGLGGWLAELRTWHFAFSLVGVVGVVYSGALVLGLRDASREDIEENGGDNGADRVGFARALASLFNRGPYLILLPYVALTATISWTVVGWMPTYLKEHFLLSQGQAGLSATGYFNFAGLLGILISGLWADRWNLTRARGYILVASIGAFAAAPGILLVGKENILAWAVLGLILYGFFVEFYDSTLMPILCQIVDSRYRATGFGVINLIATTFGGLGLYFTGVIRDLRFDTGRIFVLAAIGQFGCGALVLLVNPAGRKSSHAK